MGTTINEIVFDIGGGLPDGHTAKAVQTGGPSGGCIPANLFDTKVDFGSLAKIGQSWVRAEWSSWMTPTVW